MNCYELYAIGCAEKYIERNRLDCCLKSYRIDKVQDFTPSKAKMQRKLGKII